MINLSLSILPIKCKHVDCSKPSGMYGVCKEHEPYDILKYFMAAVKAGLCPHDPPPCFRSVTEWREYVVAAMLCRNKSERHAAPIEFCRDCTPKYKDDMMECNRCTHPEVVFIRSERYMGDVIGVPKGHKGTAAWESAVMGMHGEVVKLPPPEVIDSVLSGIAKDAEPKPRGRPRANAQRLSG